MAAEPLSPFIQNLTLASIGALLLVISFLVLTDAQRQSIPAWLPPVELVPRMISRSFTSDPPQTDLKPEEKVPTNTPSTQDFRNDLPPSTRDALARLANPLPPAKRKLSTKRDVSEEEIKENLIGFTADYRECDPKQYTCMGVSMLEIAALGDFPDYAALSGVPLPTAYKEFVIEKALARPYRPFRWKYHQTMCMSSIFLSCPAPKVMDTRGEHAC